MNRGIYTAMLSVGAAQLLKIPISYARTGRWNWSLAVEAGGMPSSHSAGVASLTTYTGLKKGIGSIEFALSTVYGLVVLYDAMGVRRHAGEIAVEVNELDEKVEELANEHPGIYHVKRHEMLKEKLGHLPEEVAAGTLFGIVMGVISYLTEPGKNKIADWLRTGWMKAR